MGKRGKNRGRGQVVVEATDLETFNANYDKMKASHHSKANATDKNSAAAASAGDSQAIADQQVLDCDTLLEKTL